MAEEEEKEETKGSVEQLAEELGWNPNWEGSEEERVGAEEYIRRQQEILSRSSQDITSLKSSISDMQGKMQEMAESHGRQVTQALEAQRQRLTEERNKAVEEGDTDAFKRADQQLNQLNQKDGKEKAFQDGLQKFRQDNPWFDSDPDLRIEAVNAGQAIGDMNPNISSDEFYSKVLDLVKQRRPEKFAGPSNRPTQVSGDKPRPSNKSKWDELMAENPEVEGIFQSNVKMGVYKDTKQDREKYATAVLNYR